jgi:hypothetical protein
VKPGASDQIVTIPSTFTFTVGGATGIETATLEEASDVACTLRRLISIVPSTITTAAMDAIAKKKLFMLIPPRIFFISKISLRR